MHNFASERPNRLHDLSPSDFLVLCFLKSFMQFNKPNYNSTPEEQNLTRYLGNLAKYN